MTYVKKVSPKGYPHYYIWDIKKEKKVKKEDSLAYIYLTAIVIKNGMNILGVSLPEKM